MLLPPPPRNPTMEYVSVGALKALAKLMAAVGVSNDLLDKVLGKNEKNSSLVAWSLTKYTHVKTSVY